MYDMQITSYDTNLTIHDSILQFTIPSTFNDPTQYLNFDNFEQEEAENHVNKCSHGEEYDKVGANIVEKTHENTVLYFIQNISSGKLTDLLHLQLITCTI